MLIKTEILILGGGAAGLFCAAKAAEGGKRVRVLESNAKPGRKLMVSGGGRCNFTNLEVSPADFVSRNPHFCKSALARYLPSDCQAWLRQAGVDYYEKEQGQLFCKKSAQEILNLLRRDCNKAGVEIQCGMSAERVKVLTAGFQVETTQGCFETRKLVVATGGLAYPSLGASDFAFRLAKQLGLAVVEPYPALVPFLLPAMRPLSGIALAVRLGVEGREIEDQLLFTHQGLSGPAILQASLFWRPGGSLTVDFFPGLNLRDRLKVARQGGERKKVLRFLALFAPERFVTLWGEGLLGEGLKQVAQLSDLEIERITSFFQAWSLTPKGTAGYKKAEVSGGGIDCRGLSSTSMEVKKIAGLYFIGETLDVTGRLGGYNLHWAWASANAAGLALAQAT